MVHNLKIKYFDYTESNLTENDTVKKDISYYQAKNYFPKLAIKPFLEITQWVVNL